MNFGGPQSPVETKPDAASLSSGLVAGSSAGGIDFPEMASGRPSSPNANYPPLSGSKHLCAICGDRASGKHYAVYSCEGCKGFFKRTVRKELTYACRENQQCLIDKRQRNRCQYCRYMKCLRQGMRREAVQEERHRANINGGGRESRDGMSGDLDGVVDLGGVGGEDPIGGDMPLDRIIEAENRCDATFRAERNDNMDSREMLQQLIDWAKMIPYFTDLRTEDQVTLIRASWNELLISSFAFRSTGTNDTIMWANGKAISRESAHLAGLGDIFDRILIELVGKMKELKMDIAELGCLRAIVLFNPDTKGLDLQPSILQVESYREKVYSTLEEYCRVKYGDADHGRFAKLLLRLPALRSIGLKCVEQLFFYKLIKDEGKGGGAIDGEDVARNLEVFIKESL